jgi:putative ABC transport system substrate-binding protein
MIARRELITLIGGAAAWPFALRAQPSGKLPRIGEIHNVRSENSEAFEQGLRDLGYVDGQNVLLETRFPGTIALDRLDEVARELPYTFARDGKFMGISFAAKLRHGSTRTCSEA